MQVGSAIHRSVKLMLMYIVDHEVEPVRGVAHLLQLGLSLRHCRGWGGNNLSDCERDG